MKPLSPTRSLSVSPRSAPLCCSTKHLPASLFNDRTGHTFLFQTPLSLALGRAVLHSATSVHCNPRPFPQLNLHNSPRPPQPRTATSKRLNRTRPELPAPFASQRKRASG